MKLTNQKLDWFSQIGEQILEIAEKYGKLKYDVSGDAALYNFSPYSVSVQFTWTEGRRGQYEDHSFEFTLPFSVITDPNWEQKLRDEIEKKKRKEKQRIELEKKERELKALAQKHIREREEYIRLKKIYEQSDN
jgi:hypothetical protein